MYEYKYVKIGERIREYRTSIFCHDSDVISLSTEKKKGYKRMTQGDLINYIKQEKLADDMFNRQMLGRLENGDSSAYKSVKMEQWIALCKVFGCSVGHLLGEDKERTLDANRISKSMGFPKDLVEKLMLWAITNPKWTQYISFILSQPEMIDILQYLDDLCFYDSAVKKYNKMMAQHPIDKMDYQRDKERIDILIQIGKEIEDMGKKQSLKREVLLHRIGTKSEMIAEKLI